MFFLMLLFWLLYYGVKGVVFKDKQIGKAFSVFAVLLGLICLFIANGFSVQFFRFLFVFYFLFSLVDYLSCVFGRKRKGVPGWFSGFSLDSKEIMVRYLVFKPFVLFVLNIVLFVKRQPLACLDDEIGVCISSKNDVKIEIKI